MAKIGLIRIDSRLIHGQVATKWIKRVEAKRVIIIDDASAADPFMITIYQMAATPGVKVEVLSTTQAGEEWKKNEFGSAGPVLILFRSVEQAYSAYNAGFTYTSMMLGGIGGGPGKINVAGPIALDHHDGEMLSALADQGVELYFQVTPEENVTQWKTVKAKYFSDIR